MSYDRLNAALAEQVDFLRASAEGFDAGRQDEAKRLGLTIRVLLHDAGGSKSLLEQLGLKSELSFLDTRRRRELPAGHRLPSSSGGRAGWSCCRWASAA